MATEGMFGSTLMLILMFLFYYVPPIYIAYLLIKALRKYLRSGEVRREKNELKQSLGEILKSHRTRCKMTQEFVAESLGVTRQAVSKWESGTTDPSTSNLIALAKLYGISVEEILQNVK